MKFENIVKTALVATLGAIASVYAQDVKPAAPAPAAQPAAPQYTDAQIVETLGWFIGKQQGFSELGFTKEQMDNLVKGMQAAAAGKEAPYDLDKIGAEISKFMQTKQQAYFAKLKDQGKAESDKFFAELKNNKNVTVLPSGLGYEILKPGTGDYPKTTDSVKVFYTGTFVNGQKFDSNVGGEPFPVSLTGGVIRGWIEGLQKINKGGKIKLYVPPQLAYGEEGNQGIPPNSALIFEVEVVDIVPPQAPAASATPASTAK